MCLNRFKHRATNLKQRSLYQTCISSRSRSADSEKLKTIRVMTATTARMKSRSSSAFS